QLGGHWRRSDSCPKSWGCRGIADETIDARSRGDRSRCDQIEQVAARTDCAKLRQFANMTAMFAYRRCRSAKCGWRICREARSSRCRQSWCCRPESLSDVEEFAADAADQSVNVRAAGQWSEQGN